MSRPDRRPSPRNPYAQSAHQDCPCGKRGYTSSHNAKRASRHMKNKFSTYRCPESGLWHVTNRED